MQSLRWRHPQPIGGSRQSSAAKTVEVNFRLPPVRCPLVPVIAFVSFMLLGVSLIMLFSVEGARGGGSAVLKQALFEWRAHWAFAPLDRAVPTPDEVVGDVVPRHDLRFDHRLVGWRGEERCSSMVTGCAHVRRQGAALGVARPTPILVLAWYFQRYRGLMHRYISGIWSRWDLLRCVVLFCSNATSARQRFSAVYVLG